MNSLSFDTVLTIWMKWNMPFCPVNFQFIPVSTFHGTNMTNLPRNTVVTSINMAQNQSLPWWGFTRTHGNHHFSHLHIRFLMHHRNRICQNSFPSTFPKHVSWQNIVWRFPDHNRNLKDTWFDLSRGIQGTNLHHDLTSTTKEHRSAIRSSKRRIPSSDQLTVTEIFQRLFVDHNNLHPNLSANSHWVYYPSQ